MSVQWPIDASEVEDLYFKADHPNPPWYLRYLSEEEHADACDAYCIIAQGGKVSEDTLVKGMMFLTTLNILRVRYNKARFYPVSQIQWYYTVENFAFGDLEAALSFDPTLELNDGRDVREPLMMRDIAVEMANRFYDYCGAGDYGITMLGRAQRLQERYAKAQGQKLLAEGSQQKELSAGEGKNESLSASVKGLSLTDRVVSVKNVGVQ